MTLSIALSAVLAVSAYLILWLMCECFGIIWLPVEVIAISFLLG